MLQETGEIRNLIWLSKPPVLRDSRTWGGGSICLPPSLPLFGVFLHFLPHTYSRCTHVVKHRRAYCTHRQADREEKVDAMILFGGNKGADSTQQCCYIVLQSNDSERTRHISMQPPSTQHALLPRSSGTTL